MKTNQLAATLLLIALTIASVAGVNRMSRPMIPATVNKPLITSNQSSLTLHIPKIKVTAPIVLEVDGFNEPVYLQALESGVAHFAGSGLPGQGKRIFLFGHSGYLRLKPGEYKTIFVQLDQLEPGDLITIENNQTSYQYQVITNRVVKADDLSVLNNTGEELLTLMTCWPPKTIRERRIVEAKPSHETLES